MDLTSLYYFSELAKDLHMTRTANRLFISQQTLSNHISDINIFPLHYKGQPLTQRLSLIRMKDRYLSHYSKFFLELLFQYFDGVEHIHLHRSVSAQRVYTGTGAV